MLIHEDTITTVTFDGSVTVGYTYPDTSMYGDEIAVLIQHHHKEDVDNSVTVTIGDKMFTPEQLERVLRQVTNYKAAAKAYIVTDETQDS